MGIPHKKTHMDYDTAEVVSIVSHQLKTPLSIIKGYLEVLVSEDLGKINNRQREYLGDILSNTHRMIRLVKELLDVSRIEEGRMELSPEPSDLKEIVRNVVEEFHFLAKAKNCTLSFHPVGEIPLLKIDSLKIKQVVINLISNAVNYTKGGGTIEVSVKKKGNRVLFTCEDNGIGISDKKKKKIFTKFYRSENAMALCTEGSGLGLFISKAIIKKSGGNIYFKSKKGEGSVFSFSLPIN